MKTIRSTAVAAWLTIFSFPALACGFHFSSPDSNVYPGSNQVFLRNIFAQSAGLVQRIDDVEGEFGFRRASLWLGMMSRQLEQMGIRESYILLVDVPMWNHHDLSAFTRLNLDLKNAPEDDGVVLMTTQAGLSALVLEEIDYSAALSEGILMIRNDLDNEVEALLMSES